MIGRNLKPNERTKLTNRSLVHDVFGDDEKLTIAEVTGRVNERLESHAKLSEMTVRRAINDLIQFGQLKAFGKVNNAQTYGKLSASFSSHGDGQLVPFAGEMQTVEDFMRLMSDPDIRPFKLNIGLLGEKRQHAIRRAMLFVILSAGEAGLDEPRKNTNEQLNLVINELEWLLNLLKGFVDSPIWYEPYRSRIADALRDVIKKDPELFKLTNDYVRSQ